ncbi:MAG: PIG-L deacetylase family protein [Brevundimonas sp.]|uniref:PIG-L deacetylase family protein n=1 Tax=Brevundimonas sp. TaxID=1871086 RepID=UPI00391BD26C
MKPLDPLSLTARRVTVIAPHPDDESLGCGGLIAALSADHRAVQVVFVTDGAGSHPNSAAWPASRLARQRRREAQAALACLGATALPPVFLDLPDAGMPALDDPAGETVVGDLAAALTAFGSELVLSPWRRDPHCDHRDAWALTEAALSRARLAPERLEYAVWLDELGQEGDQPRAGEAEAVAFDISGVLALKRRAVEAHVSQTTDLISDDPTGFRLTADTIDRLVQSVERYWRPLP